MEELQFFYPNGIHHYFRIRHKCDFMDDLRLESSRLCRTLLEEETKKCLEKCTLHETMVCISPVFVILFIYQNGSTQHYSRSL